MDWNTNVRISALCLAHVPPLCYLCSRRPPVLVKENKELAQWPAKLAAIVHIHLVHRALEYYSGAHHLHASFLIFPITFFVLVIQQHTLVQYKVPLVKLYPFAILLEHVSFC